MILLGLFGLIGRRTVLLGAGIGNLHSFAGEYRGIGENVLAREEDFEVRSGLLWGSTEALVTQRRKGEPWAS
jgi:hypothetical protein